VDCGEHHREVDDHRILWSVVVFVTMCCPAKGNAVLPVVAAKLSVLRHAVQLSMACGPIRIRTRLPALSRKAKTIHAGCCGAYAARGECACAE
jgi:hypothetical protein